MLDQNSITIDKGNKITLTANVTPENATDKEISWSSSNASVAYVDEHGVITGISGGTALITAVNGGLEARCTVTVLEVPERILLDKESILLQKDSSYQLTATVLPENTVYKKIYWTSTDETVAAVDENGTNVTFV